MFLILSIIIIACENENVNNDTENPCPEWNIQVQIRQQMRLVDSNMNWISNISPEMLTLIPTDENWTPLLNKNGEPFKQTPNTLEAKMFYNSSNKFEYIEAWFGQFKESKEINDKKCYYLLKINDDTYYKIITEYDIECNNFILTKLTFNDTEYMANDFSTIDIIIE